MKWTTLLRTLLPLTLCAALLIPASAAGPLIAPNPTSDTEESESVDGQTKTTQPVSTCVWGSLTKLENGDLHLKNSVESDHSIHEIVIHPDEAAIVDAVTGAALALEDLQDGEMVYAYVSTAMTKSLPPQAAAYVIVARIPADFGVPSYYEITDRTVISTLMTENNIIQATFFTDQGTNLTLNLTDALDEEGNRQYILKDEVRLLSYPDGTEASFDLLIPGTRLLAWTDTEGKLSQVLVFPYEYSGYLAVLEGGFVVLNGQVVELAALTDPAGQSFVPVRAVCESLGCTVTWDNTAKAMTITQDEQVLFSYAAGADAAQVNGESVALSAPSLAQDGCAYLPGADLARLLHLYLAP